MYRQTLVFAVVLTVLFSAGCAAFAQGGEECDPEMVLEWLVERQRWRNATTEMLVSESGNGSETYFNVLDELHKHSQAIADLERCACTDDLMLWTYYLYDAVERYIICCAQQRADCAERMTVRLGVYQAQIDAVFVPLEELTGFNHEDYVDLRPEGWSWPPEDSSAQATGAELLRYGTQ